MVAPTDKIKYILRSIMSKCDLLNLIYFINIICADDKK